MRRVWGDPGIVRDRGQVSGRVLGVDACERGWIVIALEEAVVGAYLAGDIETLMARAQADGPVAVAAVDMPIGLPDRGYRQADVLARAAIGPLWPSVFMTPVRQALLAADHATASAVNRQLTGKGISVQAFALKQSSCRSNGGPSRHRPGSSRSIPR